MMNTQIDHKETSSITDTIDQYKDKIVLLKDCKTVDCMTVYELARWYCLLEAIDVVDNKCKFLKHDRNDNSWIKPIAFQKFVDERTNTMMFEIINDIQAGNLEVY
jgi:hypothetical protein